MNVRRATAIFSGALLLLSAGCSEAPVDIPGDSDQDVQASRSAPRMLYHNPLGELALGLDAPARVDYTDTTIYVADPKARAIVAYARVGFAETVYPLDEPPVGIANDGAGQFYVSLLGGHDSDGTVKIYDATFDEAGASELAVGVVEFVYPTDIAIDGLGRVHVVDSGADVVYVFDDVGTLQFTIGERGAGEGQFKYPSSIAIDTANDQIVVADQDNHRIQVFDSSGGFVYAFGYRVRYIGNGLIPESWMARTAGVAVDDGGFIYLADGLLGKVRIYDQTGGELGEVLGHEDEFGGLINPADIALDPAAGLVLVVNTGVGQVQMYEEEPAGDLLTVLSTDFVGGNPGVGGEVQGWDAPHMVSDVSCSRCHDFDDQPEGHLGQAAGQANLCFSCHTSAGQAAEHMFLADGSASHPWNVDAVDEDHGSHGPLAGSPLEDHLDEGNIKCSTCHNQHNEDVAEPFLRLAIGAGILCGDCHIQKDLWDNAGHSDEESRAFTYPSGPGRESCAQCHSGLGYIDYTNGVPQEELRTDMQIHSCVVCHGPHGVTGGELLRTYDVVTLPGGHDITDAGASATCYVCHNGRYPLELPSNECSISLGFCRDDDDCGAANVCSDTGGSCTDDGDCPPGETCLEDECDNSWHLPHYALGAVMLESVNGAEFGLTPDVSNHSTNPAVTCVRCHMSETPADGDPGHNTVGGHTWEMTDPDTGIEHVAACLPCHNLADFNRPAGDYDGDQVLEGVQDEVTGLLGLVHAALEGIGMVDLGHYPYWDYGGVDDGDLDLARQAVWNYEYVDNDGSLGVHNTGYAVGLLQITYLQLTGNPVPNAVLRYQ